MKRLGFSQKIEIDVSRLIISGHSFGGITAINMAKEDSRIKLCATLDPWLFAHHKEIIEG
jgi:dipeptidyl aminopeptidase/acylaminoacyl peptidase